MTTPSTHPNPSESYQDLVLTTKLQPPSSIQSVISRPRLLQQLDRGITDKLTLLCAPAGSGKTTLLTDWLRSWRDTTLPIAWVALDERDNDPTCFWHYVCIALEQIDVCVGQHLSLFLEEHLYTNEVILTRLMNILAEATTPFVLVLDDYHVVTDASIHHALHFLIERMPGCMHLVLITRSEPPLPIARLRVRRQVTEIRENDLRFTSEEVKHFLIHTMRLPCTYVQSDALTERTEGWIAGIQLAALALHDHSGIDAFVSSFSGSNRSIVDYFVEEVLSHQSKEVQIFLLSTSILDRICISLCASIFDPQSERNEQNDVHPADTYRHAQQMLDYVERANLFLLPLDHQRKWYRYHHLFAQALQAHFALLYPLQFTEAHRRASLWYEQHGSLSEAITHALAAEDFGRASYLMEHVDSTQADSCESEYSPTFDTPTLACRSARTSRKLSSNSQSLFEPLSERELEVLHLLAVGKPNAAIAQKLVIAPATVKRHLSNMFSKLEVTNRTQAVAQARDLGIL